MSRRVATHHTGHPAPAGAARVAVPPGAPSGTRSIAPGRAGRPHAVPRARFIAAAAPAATASRSAPPVYSCERRRSPHAPRHTAAGRTRSRRKRSRTVQPASPSAPTFLGKAGPDGSAYRRSAGRHPSPRRPSPPPRPRTHAPSVYVARAETSRSAAQAAARPAPRSARARHLPIAGPGRDSSPRHQPDRVRRARPHGHPVARVMESCRALGHAESAASVRRTRAQAGRRSSERADRGFFVEAPGGPRLNGDPLLYLAVPPKAESLALLRGPAYAAAPSFTLALAIPLESRLRVSLSAVPRHASVFPASVEAAVGYETGPTRRAPPPGPTLVSFPEHTGVQRRPITRMASATDRALPLRLPTRGGNSNKLLLIA